MYQEENTAQKRKVYSEIKNTTILSIFSNQMRTGSRITKFKLLNDNFQIIFNKQLDIETVKRS